MASLLVIARRVVVSAGLAWAGVTVTGSEQASEPQVEETQAQESCLPSPIQLDQTDSLASRVCRADGLSGLRLSTLIRLR